MSTRASRLILCVALAMAGCAGPRTSAPPQTTPVAHGGAAGREVRPSIDQLVKRPAVLDEIENTYLKEPPPLQPLVARTPPDPGVRLPSRPIAKGEARELADLAFARGDAFDAAAQYRVLVDARDFAVARYARFQLARAYAAIGEPQKAELLFDKLACAGDDFSWPAIVLLGELRASYLGGPAALEELRPDVGGRFEVQHRLDKATVGRPRP